MQAPLPPHGSVLLLIDLQKAIDHPSWGTRNNPSAETKIAQLLAHWRSKAWPVWHVKRRRRRYRFGSLADILTVDCHVRFTPESGLDWRPPLYQFYTNLPAAPCSMTKQSDRRNDNGCRELANRREPPSPKSPELAACRAAAEPLHGSPDALTKLWRPVNDGRRAFYRPCDIRHNERYRACVCGIACLCGN
jgi:hypothetical protein